MMPGFGYGGCGFGAFGTWGWILNAVIGLIVIAGLIWLTIWAARRFSAGGNTGGSYPVAAGAPSARELAQMRYARGEITREQYQQLLDDLSR